MRRGDGNGGTDDTTSAPGAGSAVTTASLIVLVGAVSIASSWAWLHAKWWAIRPRDIETGLTTRELEEIFAAKVVGMRWTALEDADLATALPRRAHQRSPRLIMGVASNGNGRVVVRLSALVAAGPVSGPRYAYRTGVRMSAWLHEVARRDPRSRVLAQRSDRSAVVAPVPRPSMTRPDTPAKQPSPTRTAARRYAATDHDPCLRSEPGVSWSVPPHGSSIANPLRPAWMTAIAPSAQRPLPNPVALALDKAMPPAGWYPDRRREAALRWWNGTQWTAHVHPGLAASAGVDARR
jgi:hypothetical protein